MATTTVKTLDDVRKVLFGCPDETLVEVERGINHHRAKSMVGVDANIQDPVTAKMVAELRALSV